MKHTNEQYSDWMIQSGLKFWELYDFIFNDNKTEIYHCLYLDLSFKNYTIIKLCFILHISESTLLRYKRMFERSINYFRENATSFDAVKEIKFVRQNEP